jgi:hypothetical protein
VISLWLEQTKFSAINNKGTWFVISFWLEETMFSAINNKGT